MQEESSPESLDPLQGPPASVISEPTEVPRQSFFREIPWRWYDLVIAFLPLIAIRNIGSLVNPTALSAVPRWAWFALELVNLGWTLAYPLFIASLRVRVPSFPRRRAILVELRHALCIVLAVVLYQIGMFAFVSRMPGESDRDIFPFEPLVPSPFEPLFRSSDWFGALSVIILATSIGPIAEEVFFRGMLHNALRQRLHWVVAAIIQAIVFALCHPFDLLNRVLVAVGGLWLAFIYEKRKTILAPICFHILGNGLALGGLIWSIAAFANAPILGVAGDAHGDGCIITVVMSPSGAEAAGLRVGDVVTAISGKGVRNIRGMYLIVRRKHVGEQVTVDFLRDGKPRHVEATLRARPK